MYDHVPPEVPQPHPVGMMVALEVAEAARALTEAQNLVPLPRGAEQREALILDLNKKAESKAALKSAISGESIMRFDCPLNLADLKKKEPLIPDLNKKGEVKPLSNLSSEF